jgi:hypothetical protein
MNQAHGFKKALTFFFRAVGSRHFVTPDFNPATFEIKTEFHRNEPFNQRNTLFIYKKYDIQNGSDLMKKQDKNVEEKALALVATQRVLSI